MNYDCQSESHLCILFVAYGTIESTYCIEKFNSLNPYHCIHLKTVVLELQNSLTGLKRSYLPEKTNFYILSLPAWCYFLITENKAINVLCHT